MDYNGRVSLLINGPFHLDGSWLDANSTLQENWERSLPRYIMKKIKITSYDRISRDRFNSHSGCNQFLYSWLLCTGCDGGCVQLCVDSTLYIDAHTTYKTWGALVKACPVNLDNVAVLSLVVKAGSVVLTQCGHCRERVYSSGRAIVTVGWVCHHLDHHSSDIYGQDSKGNGEQETDLRSFEWVCHSSHISGLLFPHVWTLFSTCVQVSLSSKRNSVRPTQARPSKVMHGLWNGSTVLFHGT